MLGLSDFPKKEKKEDPKESSCTKTELFFEALTTEKLTVTWRWMRLEFEDQDESDQKSFFDWFCPSTFRWEEMNALFGNQVTFYKWINPFDTLTNEMQPVNLEKKNSDSQDKLKTLGLARNFGPLRFQYRKDFPKHCC